MDYEGFFKQRLDALRAEERYRVFADLERPCGRFPRAYDHRIGAEVRLVHAHPKQLRQYTNRRASGPRS